MMIKEGKEERKEVSLEVACMISAAYSTSRLADAALDKIIELGVLNGVVVIKDGKYFASFRDKLRPMTIGEIHAWHYNQAVKACNDAGIPCSCCSHRKWCYITEPATKANIEIMKGKVVE